LALIKIYAQILINYSDLKICFPSRRCRGGIAVIRIENVRIDAMCGIFLVRLVAVVVTR
tara:strand:+ start:19823 stop:19999 length:177 start_codon:yes stop_codon:yes gene_type:complete